MTPHTLRKACTDVGACSFVILIALLFARAQTAVPPPQLPASPSTQSTPKPPAQTAKAVVRGVVRDERGKPAADAVVFLQHATEVPGAEGIPTQAIETQTTRTNGAGAFSFPSLDEGSYTLRAERTNSERTARVRVELGKNETKAVDLSFLPPQSSQEKDDSPEKSSPAANPPEFFDQPQFTVAGITQITNSGGHGSDMVLRTSEALVRATGSLATGSASKQSLDTSSESQASATTKSVDTKALDEQRAAIQARIVRDDNLPDDAARQEQSSLHHQLAQLDEELGDPLESVREYQHAAELSPSEAHLFDWASELLMHGAFEPATEVLAQGANRYPQSVRMLLGSGVAWYARGSEDRAADYLAAASDLAPADPTSYLFMGRMQSAETVPSQECVDRLARFARLAPDNAMANYYYAAGLSKRVQSTGALDDATSKQIEQLLQRAIQLDPSLGVAYLELGILYVHQGDYTRAIAAYQHAIAATPDLEEAHYRLAQAYRHTGNEAAAKKEFQLHEELAKKSKEEAERQRREVRQFVVLLRQP